MLDIQAPTMITLSLEAILETHGYMNEKVELWFLF
jgi:hypothetical protein